MIATVLISAAVLAFIAYVAYRSPWYMERSYRRWLDTLPVADAQEVAR